MAPGVILRPFFTEAPYTAALCTERLLDRCSGCFGAASDHWLCHCGKIAYCSETCQSSDLPWHQCECLAFRTNSRPRFPSLELDVRLLGRLIARYIVDHGFAVLTSSGFPGHLVKDRTLDDLMSHERDFLRTSSFDKHTTQMLDVFYAFFQSTQLGSLKRDVVKRWNYVACINGFSVTALTSPDSPDSMTYLGETLYLNASRFNHSCEPSLVFGFHGCTLDVRYVDRDGNSDDKCITMKKKEFKALTFNYGYGSKWNYGCSLTSTPQRIESLKARYFFRCRCELCRDKLKNILESDSSSVECFRCGKPYVWRVQQRSRKAKLTKICRCPMDRSIADKSHWCRDPNAQQTASVLSENWTTAMTRISKLHDPNVVIQECEAIRPTAVRYWNRSHNLRLGQLCEQEFGACLSVVRKMDRDNKSGQPSSSSSPSDLHFRVAVHAAVEVGETMLASYKKYAEPYNVCMAQLYQQMGFLYGLCRTEAAAKRGSESYLAAAEIWKMHGEKGCQKYFEDLSASLTTEAKSVQEIAEPKTNGELVAVIAQ